MWIRIQDCVINFEENFYFFYYYKKIMAQTFLSVESLNGEFVLILTPFTSVLSNIYMRDPDPDPQSS